MPAEPEITPPPKTEDRRPMVGWFDPAPLMATGLNVLVSTLFGRHSDYRLLEALTAGGNNDIHDYSKMGEARREEFWLDYIADRPRGKRRVHRRLHRGGPAPLPSSCERRTTCGPRM